MKPVVPAFFVAAVLVAPLVAHPPSEHRLPMDHPPVTTQPARGVMPPGHPPMTPPPAAHVDDVADPLAIVHAYYDAISGPVDKERDWTRFKSLFLPGARLVTVNVGGPTAEPVIMSADQFVQMNRKYFEGTGYMERSIREDRSEFAHVAQVWSTYEAGRGGPDGKTYSRGITSFQLVRAKDRWWIADVAWDRERGDAVVPAKYLPSNVKPTR
jgi:hypothetical protein